MSNLDSYVFSGSHFPSGATAKVTCYNGNSIISSEEVKLSVTTVKPSVVAWFEPSTITSTGMSMFVFS